MSNKAAKKQAARASNASKATQESQPTDDTCEDTGSQSASEFMEFVRRSLNTLNSKFDAFVERQEKLELRVTAVEVRVTSQEKAVEGVVESIDFTAEKVNNIWHSLETLQKALAEATREIADSHIAMAKLSKTVSRQERHSRAPSTAVSWAFARRTARTAYIYSSALSASALTSLSERRSRTRIVQESRHQTDRAISSRDSTAGLSVPAL